MVIAKTQGMFECLKEQFQNRRVEKIYNAVVWGNFSAEKMKGIMNKPDTDDAWRFRDRKTHQRYLDTRPGEFRVVLEFSAGNEELAAIFYATVQCLQELFEATQRFDSEVAPVICVQAVLWLHDLPQFGLPNRDKSFPNLVPSLKALIDGQDKERSVDTRCLKKIRSSGRDDSTIFSGFFACHAEHINLFNACIWIPLGFLFVLKMLLHFHCFHLHYILIIITVD